MGELYDPRNGKPHRRVHVAMSLLDTRDAGTAAAAAAAAGSARGTGSPPAYGAGYAALGSTPTSVAALIAAASKPMNTVCQCSRCLGAPCALVVSILRKRSSSKQYILPAPFRAVLVPGCPDQLRVYKDPCTDAAPGTCLVLFPKKSPEEWLAAVGDALGSYGETHTGSNNSGNPNGNGGSGGQRKLELPPDTVRVRRLLGVEQQGVNVVNVVRRRGEKAEVWTVTQVMEWVVGRHLDAIPTRFVLCFSGGTKHSRFWTVEDDAPVALHSFIGETLYVYERKVEASIALDEWLDWLAAARGGGVNAWSQLLRINADRAHWAELMPGVLASFIWLGDRSIAAFYDTLYRRAPPLTLCHRLHGLEDSVHVKYGECVEFRVPVTNSASKALVVDAELSVPAPTVDYGVDVAVWPRCAVLPEGATRTFRLTFYGTAPVADATKQGAPYALCFWARPLDPRAKLRLRDIPFIVPFQYTVVPADRDDHETLNTLSFVELDDMALLSELPPSQGCPVALVRYHGRSFVRKAIPLRAVSLADPGATTRITVTTVRGAPTEPQTPTDDDGKHDIAVGVTSSSGNGVVQSTTSAGTAAAAATSMGTTSASSGTTSTSTGKSTAGTGTTTATGGTKQIVNNNKMMTSEIDPCALALQSLREELNGMQRLKYPSLLTVWANIHDPRSDTLYLLLPFAGPVVPLRSLIADHATMTPLLRLKVALDVADGLRHLAHFNLALGNLCLDNVYVVSRDCAALGHDAAGAATNAVIADIGHVGSLFVTRLNEFQHDTIPFWAPELISFERAVNPVVHLDEKLPRSDVFSFGLVLYALLAGAVPYMNGWGREWNSIDELIRLIVRTHYRPDLARVASAPLARLIDDCLAEASLHRPTADAVVRRLSVALNDALVRENGAGRALPDDAGAGAPGPGSPWAGAPALTASAGSSPCALDDTAPVRLSPAKKTSSCITRTTTAAGALTALPDAAPAPPLADAPRPGAAPLEPNIPTVHPISLTQARYSGIFHPSMKLLTPVPVPQTSSVQQSASESKVQGQGQGQGQTESGKGPEGATTPAPGAGAGTGASASAQSPGTQTQPSGTSRIVRLLREKEGLGPVSVRVSVATAGVEHLLSTFRRLHAATEGMSLVDADTKEALTTAHLRQRLERAARPVDVVLCRTSELVEVNASIISDSEDAKDDYITLRVHNAAVTEDMCRVVARAFHTEALRLLYWDFSAVPFGVACLGADSADPDAPADLVFAHTADLIPVTVTVTLVEGVDEGNGNSGNGGNGNGNGNGNSATGTTTAGTTAASTNEGKEGTNMSTNGRETGNGKGSNSNSNSANGMTKSKTMLFYKQVTVAAVFRTVLLALFKSQAIFARELEFLDPLRQPIDEPASLTLEQCITRCGFAELPDGATSYRLEVNDGVPIAVSYRGRAAGTAARSACTLVVPPSGATLAALLARAHRAMGLPGAPGDYIISTASGVALLDTTTDVDQMHAEEGLVIVDAQSLLRVTVNDDYALGFAQESRPTVATLVATMGLLPDTAVCYDEVVVDNAATPLVQGGSYYAVEVHADQFVGLDLLLPGDAFVPVTVTLACTVAQLLSVLALVHPELLASPDDDAAAHDAAARDPGIPALVDETDCILADDLPAADFPHTTLQYCLL